MNHGSVAFRLLLLSFASLQLQGFAQRVPGASAEFISVSGTVRDARTKAPLTEFLVIPGFGNPSEFWLQSHEQQIFTDGKYQIDAQHKPGLMRGVSMTVICIEADGYAAEVVRVPTAEDHATNDVELRSAPNITGRVVDQAGQPLPGAVVVRRTRGFSYRIENGHVPRDLTIPTTVTDSTGRFSLRPGAGDVTLDVLHDSGFREVPADALDSEKPIRLQPWGRVEGKVMLGKEPIGHARLHLAGSGKGLSRWYGETANGKGEFTFERVVPGLANIEYVVENEDGVLIGRASTEVEVKPGETAQVQIGGRGRTVSGQVLLPEGAPMEWKTHGAILVPIRDGKRAPNPKYRAVVENDGYFCFDDVEPGRYALHVQYSSMDRDIPVPEGAGSKEIEVSDNSRDEPVDVGELEVEPTEFYRPKR